VSRRGQEAIGVQEALGLLQDPRDDSRRAGVSAARSGGLRAGQEVSVVLEAGSPWEAGLRWRQAYVGGGLALEAGSRRGTGAAIENTIVDGTAVFDCGPHPPARPGLAWRLR